MVSSNWDRVSLGDVCRVEAGAGFPIIHQGLKNHEFPFFKVGDMNTAGNEKEMHVFQHSISEEIRKKLRAIAFPAGTIVFPKIGAAIATNKKRMLVKPSCVDNNVMAIIPSENLVSSFLFYLLLNKDLSDFANTGNPPSIRQSNVEEWTIPLPPLTEQKRIASLLARADRLRQLRRTAHDLGDALLQSVFLEMFGDPLINAKGWQVIKLSAAFAIKPQIGSPNPAHHGGKYLVVRVGEIGDAKVELERSQRITIEGIELERFRLKPGDFLLARAIGSEDHLGKASILQDTNQVVVYDSHVMRLRFDTKIMSPFFFWHWLKSDGGRARFMQRAGRTAVQFNVNTEQIADINIPLPPLSLQEEFAGVVARIEGLRGRMAEARRQAEGLFESLLSESFGGQQ